MPNFVSCMKIVCNVNEGGIIGFSSKPCQTGSKEDYSCISLDLQKVLNNPRIKITYYCIIIENKVF